MQLQSADIFASRSNCSAEHSLADHTHTIIKRHEYFINKRMYEHDFQGVRFFVGPDLTTISVVAHYTRSIHTDLVALYIVRKCHVLIAELRNKQSHIYWSIMLVKSLTILLLTAAN